MSPNLITEKPVFVLVVEPYNTVVVANELVENLNLCVVMSVTSNINVLVLTPNASLVPLLCTVAIEALSYVELSVVVLSA